MMNKAMETNLILLGSERSGSNLLRVLLGNHSQIEAPVPVHFCDAFCGLIPRYGGLSHKDNAVRLIEHMLRYANSDFSDWKLCAEPSDLVNDYHVDSFAAAFNAVHSEKCKQSGKAAWFCKDNHMNKYAFQLLSEFPGLRFVHLYRDPRDQVASWMRNPLFLLTPRKAVKKWVEEQESIRQLIEVWNLPTFGVGYEDLVQDPESTMTTLLNWLDLDAENACFETSGNNEEASKLPQWENLKKPIMRDNYNQYVDVLSTEDVALIEHYARDSMEWLGYRSSLKKTVNFKGFLARLHEYRTARINKSKVREGYATGRYSVIEAKRAIRKGILAELES